VCVFSGNLVLACCLSPCVPTTCLSLAGRGLAGVIFLRARALQPLSLYCCGLGCCIHVCAGMILRAGHVYMYHTVVMRPQHASVITQLMYVHCHSSESAQIRSDHPTPSLCIFALPCMSIHLISYKSIICIHLISYKSILCIHLIVIIL
jgi:hypothetical protein